MNEKTSSTKSYLVAAIIFSVLALLQLVGLTEKISILGLLGLAGEVIIAVSLFMKKRDIFPVLGFALLAVMALVTLIVGFKENNYMLQFWNYSWSGWRRTTTTDYRFNLFCMLPDLAVLASYLWSTFVMTAFFTDYFKKYRESNKKLWFVPAIIYASSIVFAIIAFISASISGGSWTYYLLFLSPAAIIRCILWVVGILFTFLWAAYPEGLASDNPEGYCGMVKHLLLWVFTFGIWQMIWVYRTTKYLNRVDTEPKQRPGIQLLAYLFYPFYSIYWVYKNSQRLDIMTNNHGISHNNISTLCLVLSLVFIFVPIAPILMQDRINTIVLMDNPSNFDSGVTDDMTANGGNEVSTQL